MAATEDALARVALWLEQVLAAQVLACKRVNESLQAAADGVMNAQDPRQLLDLRDTLLAAVLEDLAHWQSETIDAWCSLQRDLARHTALSAAEAAEEVMSSLWHPQPPSMMRTQPVQGAKAPAGDETFKAWQRLWLPWIDGADAPSRA